ncbi:MAG TPA: DUF4258 domain-containing protein [Anaerolineae bacterium]|nr:DUF4258 domain-containing protein [Anaerolineae bacterium]
MIEYTKHARQRMKERHVSEDQVEATILDPESWQYGEDGEIIATRKVGKRRVEVAHLSLPEKIKVITVMVD